MRSQLLVLGAVVVAVGWLGCASDETEPLEEDLGPTPTGTTSSKPDAAARPDFEAGFVEPDAGPEDPTPPGGDTCVDNGDPGSTENGAKGLPDTDDGVDKSITVKGILSGPVDIDFYKLKMSDVGGGRIGTDLSISTAGVEMCVFVKCVSGSTNWKGCEAGVETTSPNTGDKGCCASGPNKANPKWSCGGIFQSNDTATLFFRIKQSQDKCLPYSFSYVF